MPHPQAARGLDLQGRRSAKNGDVVQFDVGARFDVQRPAAAAAQDQVLETQVPGFFNVGDDARTADH